MDGSRTRMLHAILESTGLAMDRIRARQERQKSNEAIVQERYRGNLLRAISHDLRTAACGHYGHGGNGHEHDAQGRPALPPLGGDP